MSYHHPTAVGFVELPANHMSSCHNTLWQLSLSSAVMQHRFDLFIFKFFTPASCFLLYEAALIQRRFLHMLRGRTVGEKEGNWWSCLRQLVVFRQKLEVNIGAKFYLFDFKIVINYVLFCAPRCFVQIEFSRKSNFLVLKPEVANSWTVDVNREAGSRRVSWSTLYIHFS